MQSKKYTILSHIGGPSSNIYKGIQINDKKFVAIKKISYSGMNSKRKQQIVQQVNTVKDIKSSHIIQYYDHYVMKNQSMLYVVMEYCQKDNLKAILMRNQGMNKILSEIQIWDIFTHIVMGVADMHNYKNAVILHRDIKPSNVFFDCKNQVKLGNFSLMRKLNPQEHYSSTLLKQTYYLSPQQVQLNVFTTKTDIWALGCLLYEMCTYNVPFPGTNQFEIINKIRQNHTQMVPYSKQLNRIIYWCLQKKPQYRPNSTDLINIPQISCRIKQKRLLENYQIFKMRQQEIQKKIKQLSEKSILLKYGKIDQIQNNTNKLIMNYDNLKISKTSLQK